jgi:hypothetical protein
MASQLQQSTSSVGMEGFFDFGLLGIFNRRKRKAFANEIEIMSASKMSSPAYVRAIDLYRYEFNEEPPHDIWPTTLE